MSILVFENGVAEAPTRYRPRSAPGVTAGSEKWLQDIVFRHPELIPIDEIDHGSAGVALKEYSANGKDAGLILATSKGPGDGWSCVPYVSKAADKLHKAA